MCLAQGHNTVTPVRLEPTALRFRIKYLTTEPLCSLFLLRVNQLGKLIDRIQCSRLLISTLSGSASRTHVESLGKPRDVNKCS